jgi:hypothetical protein
MDVIQNFSNSIIQFLTREGRMGGWVRLFLIVFIVLAVVFLSAGIFTPPETYPWVLFTWEGLRYWIFPLVGLFSAFLLAGHYVRDLYELPNARAGMRYIFSTMFGYYMPVLRIEDGEMTVPQGRPNPLAETGGPGYLYILPGNLVLLENAQGPSNAYPAGFYYVSRREKLKEIVRLDDQHGYIDSTKAITKDGIQVTAREIRYLFRLRPSRRNGEYVPRSPLVPFPFNMQAMRRFAYNRAVGPNGLTPLTQAMDTIVSGAINEYISSHRFDDIVSPNWDVETQPRAEIWSNLLTRESFQQRFRNLGMELIWVDIGHFDVQDEIWNWRIRAWGATWRGTADIPRSLGQVRSETYRRIALAEERADALRLIIEDLNDARLQGEPQQNLRRLVLLYTAQIMDELNSRRKQSQLPGDQGESDKP